MLYALDLIGVFAFACFGAYKALQKRMDLFGVVTCAALTALGGGAIREVLIGSRPIFLSDPNYIGVVLGGVLFTVAAYHHFHKLNRYMLVLDAVGLTTFAYIGAHRATAAGLGLGSMIFFATLTGVGGGILCDIVLGRPSRLFYGDLYAVPAMTLGATYWLARPILTDARALILFLLLFFTMRLIALGLRWNLWRPHHGSAITPAPARESPHGPSQNNAPPRAIPSDARRAPELRDYAPSARAGA